ncbi:MAG: hypothetical protein KDD64_14575 [Bdellovibrionales bacterium]|nr:hypothetical protein [Bdellovibrionales bacterium]
MKAILFLLLSFAILLPSAFASASDPFVGCEEVQLTSWEAEGSYVGDGGEEMGHQERYCAAFTEVCVDVDGNETSSEPYEVCIWRHRNPRFDFLASDPELR